MGSMINRCRAQKTKKLIFVSFVHSLLLFLGKRIILKNYILLHV